MKVLRLIAVAFIFVVSSAAWVVLGASVWGRTEAADETLRTDVGAIYGQSQRQRAPSFTYTTSGTSPTTPLGIAGTDISANSV